MSHKKSSNGQKSLFDFGVSKKARFEEKSGENEMPTETNNCQEEAEAAERKAEESSVIKAQEVSAGTEKNVSMVPSQTDIAFYLNKQLTSENKFNILQNLPSPEDNYRFPTRIISSQKRTFMSHYLGTYKWLCYSKTLDAAFCKFCFVFAKEKGSGGVHKSSLVRKGYINWKNASSELKDHNGAEQHDDSVLFGENFISSYLRGSNDAMELLNKKLSEDAQKNKLVLTSIIRTIILLGKQNISFRGNNDHGRINLSETTGNEGNFRAFIRHLAIYYDPALQAHLEDSTGNAMYTSAQIQNEIINICGSVILEKIVKSINDSKCFSIIADETTDVSTKEQLTVCIRYVTNQEPHGLVIREDFIGFSIITDQSGAGLSSSILEKLQDVGLDLFYLSGQSYDGASAMCSDLVGVKTRIQEKFPKAIYTYCSNHCLNLVISNSCTNKFIRNMIGVIKEVTSFFSRSAKRCNILRGKICLQNEDKRITGLISLCETRWVDRHDALIRFAELYPIVVETMEEIEEKSNDSKTRVKAHLLLKSLCSADFIISLMSALKLFSLTYPLSKSLQDPQSDLKVCYDQVSTVIKVISDMREKADEEFSSIFKRSMEQCQTLGIEVELPRICNRRAQRENLEDIRSMDGTAAIEAYYRQSLFIPFLDDFLESLTSRFENHTSNVCILLQLIPPRCLTCTETDLKEVFDFYMSDTTESYDLFEAEFRIWKEKWNATPESSQPRSALETLRCCNSQLFPNIFKLLRILSSLPISVATAERTFSCLRRLKTYLRSTMKEDRLSSLALMNIHYDTEIDTDAVLTKFKQSNRRIVLP